MAREQQRASRTPTTVLQSMKRGSRMAGVESMKFFSGASFGETVSMGGSGFFKVPVLKALAFRIMSKSRERWSRNLTLRIKYGEHRRNCSMCNLPQYAL